MIKDNGALIGNIDMAISKEFETLKNEIDSWEFTEIHTFPLTTNTIEICDKSHDFPGIYFFEILIDDETVDASQWLKEFGIKWQDPAYHKKFVSGIKSIRVKAHLTLKQWMPLYIGKSHTVGKRINEHVLKELDKTTFAMKLKARTNLHGNKFRVSAIKIQIENYDAIMPHIEYKLRQKYNPIIGKQ